MRRILENLRELDDKQKITLAIVCSIIIALLIAVILSYTNILIRNLQVN